MQKKALSLFLVLILVSLCSCTQTTVVTSEIELPIENSDSSSLTSVSSESSIVTNSQISQTESNSNYITNHQHHHSVNIIATNEIYDNNFCVTQRLKEYTFNAERKSIDRIGNSLIATINIRIIEDEKQLYNEFQSAMLSGQFFADVVCLPKGTAFPSIAQNGYAKCLDDYDKYFDFSSSDWVDNLTNQSMLIDSKHYYLACDKDIAKVAGKGILFNNNLFKVLNEKTPHDYIKNNEWTLENFKNLITKTTCKKNNIQYYGIYMNNSIPTNSKIGNSFYESIADAVSLTEIEYESFDKEKELWQDGRIAMKIVDSLERFSDYDNNNTYFALLPQECENEYNTDQIPVYIIPSNVEEYRMEKICEFILAWSGNYEWRQNSGEQLKPCMYDEYSYELLSKTVELSLKN